jgi:opacity protein-like surface antigen
MLPLKRNKLSFFVVNIRFIKSNHVKRPILFSVFYFLLVLTGFAQSGGNTTYPFLNLVTSARIAAMGGNSLAVYDHDLGLAAVNPSLLSPQMSNQLAMQFVDYYTDINYGSVYFSRTFKKAGSFSAGIHYIDYGKFDRTDVGGDIIGSFVASEYAMQIGWGRRLDSNFSIGANIKPVVSYMDGDRSVGLGTDLAATYHNSKKDLAVSFLARNAGRQISREAPGEMESFPFTTEIAVTKRLKHLPFRYSITYHHLEKFDLTFSDPLVDDPSIDPLTNQPIKEDKVGKFADKLARHFIIGGEFMPSKNFSVRLGYNYLRRKELGVDTRMSTVGISWGFGFRIKQFQFNYARSANHLAGSPNYISLIASLGDWIK